MMAYQKKIWIKSELYIITLLTTKILLANIIIDGQIKLFMAASMGIIV